MSLTFFSDAHYEADRTKLPVLSGYFLQDGDGYWGWVVNTTFSMVRWKFSRFSKVPDIATVSPHEQHDLSHAQNLQLHRNFMGIHGAAVVSFDTPTAQVQLHVAGNKNNVEVAMQWVSNLSQRITWAAQSHDRQTSHEGTEEKIVANHDDDDEIAESPDAVAADQVALKTELVELVEHPLKDVADDDEATLPTATTESTDSVTESETSTIDAEAPVKESSSPPQDTDGKQANAPSAPSKSPRRVSSVSSLLKARRKRQSSFSRPRQPRASAMHAAATKIVYAKPKPAASVPRPVMQAAAAKTFDFSF